jgi:hypothetical protein
VLVGVAMKDADKGLACDAGRDLASAARGWYVTSTSVVRLPTGAASLRQCTISGTSTISR